MAYENLEKEELLKIIKELETENIRLKTNEEKAKKKSKKKNKRNNIKTTPKEIVDYWAGIQDECGLSVDWAEGEEICWRCGCKKKLQRCHIIPDSLGGKDEPANLVLLCERCHIDAPNVESKTFMWDWIRANGTSFYNTFWDIRAQKEYEFIYNKSYIQELKERDILTPRDLEIFYSLPIGRSVNHFAHPWKNDSTNAGLLRMRIEVYDKKYPNKKPRTAHFREKEEKFDKLVRRLCAIASEYNWNIWEGRTSNPFSITISAFLVRDKERAISIKLCRNNKYKACFTSECNPNNNCAKEYVIELGEDENGVEEFVREKIVNLCNTHGMPDKQEFVFTINPIYRLREE